MKENQLKTASELNQILSRELERTSKIIETSVEHQSTLNGTSAIASACLTYLADQIYYEWLTSGVSPSEMENHTIIIKSIRYPPFLIDPFGLYDQWMEKYSNLQKIHFDDQITNTLQYFPLILMIKKKLVSIK
ncbi:unnamed protein product [Adineta steineri]|uniref:Uncharacterized protein n=1 Tax=Adineta steineri TaxID=433720 RepID=A0A819P6G0_9BILA|nr:unnamed protein product [Adineta steineri]CAF1451562.1 unnamed protein product [Adineta steineri]CAF3891917.1 unnamed protein product [Adineta steineri]CAF4003383.1 unnamed protein product [Adineta steineri]